MGDRRELGKLPFYLQGRVSILGIQKKKASKNSAPTRNYFSKKIELSNISHEIAENQQTNLHKLWNKKN